MRLIDGDYLADLIRYKIDIHRHHLSAPVLAIMDGFASAVDLSPTIDPLKIETFFGTVTLDGMIKTDSFKNEIPIEDDLLRALRSDGPSIVASGGVPFPTNVEFDPFVERGSFNGGVSYYLPKEPKKKHKKRHKAWVKECAEIRARVADTAERFMGTIDLGVVRGETGMSLNDYDIDVQTFGPIEGQRLAGFENKVDRHCICRAYEVPYGASHVMSDGHAHGLHECFRANSLTAR